ncbi:hypothetical protein TWF694_001842 [Orbilia ellipsospora]|uniref:Uncharacterized protein n=1 Tax=Orbilia ellipsospora TaxID=2528407 RepID=A0AAV9X3U4_9PEZI
MAEAAEAAGGLVADEAADSIMKQVGQKIFDAGEKIIGDKITKFVLGQISPGSQSDKNKLSKVYDELTRIEHALKAFENLTKQALSEININVLSQGPIEKVIEMKSLLKKMQQRIKNQQQTNPPNEDLKSLIEDFCHEIDKKVLSTAEYIYEMVAVTGVEDSLLLTKWKSILQNVVDPVNAYKSIKACSLYYQTALGYAIILLHWQKCNDPNKVRGGDAGENVKKVERFMKDWDKHLENNSSSIIPYKVSNWAMAFLPENRKGVPIKVAWDAFLDTGAGETWGVKYTQPPSQHIFDTGLQTMPKVTNTNIDDTDMVFSIYRDNNNSTYTIILANPPAGADAQCGPMQDGKNALSVVPYYDDHIPVALYNNLKYLTVVKPTPLSFQIQIDPTTVKDPTSSKFRFNIKAAPGTPVAGRPLVYQPFFMLGIKGYRFMKFGNKTASVSNKFNFRIFPSTLPGLEIPVL